LTLYEGMFLLDNTVVREDWKKAKGLVTEALAKHGGTVRTARRWDERRLAYKIRGRQRATYLLTHFDIPGDHLPALRRELDLSERVLRHLILRVLEVPPAELELHAAENAEGFTVPAPPPDDVPEQEPVEEAREAPAAPPEEGETAPGEERPRGRREARASAEVVS